LKKIIEAPLDQDLKPLSVFWHQQRIPHRISEERGKQVISVPDEQQADQLVNEYQRFSNGELQIQLSRVQSDNPEFNIREFYASYPVTLTLVLLSVIGYLLAEFRINNIVALLVIQSMDASALPVLLDIPHRISTAEYLSHGHYWRLFTPVFLHFGLLHITFNMLWMWELGKRIEVQGGSLHLLLVVIVIGVASNLYQAAATPVAVFGGMSGVIYGLLGYCAVFNLIVPSQRLQLPLAIYVLMLASLAIGYLGFLDFLARMANTAHLSGLIIGLIMGAFSALVYRYVPGRAS